MAPTHSERLVAICLILLSMTLGLLVHPFYDWTGADQSRPVALLWQVPLSVTAVLAIFCIALPWLPIRRTEEAIQQPLQFSLRLMLIATGVVALSIAVGTHYPGVFAGLALLFAGSLVFYWWWRFPLERWSISAFLSAMYLPFISQVWSALGQVSLIWQCTLLASFPALLPTFLVFRQPTQSMPEATRIAIAMAFTSLEIAAGLGLIHLGPKRGIAFVVLALIGSLFGALVLDALMRM